MTCNVAYVAIAFILSSFGWILAGWWVWNARDKFRFYIPRIEDVAYKMISSSSSEDPVTQAKRIKAMSDDELIREIQRVRQLTEWGTDIIRFVSDLKASVPFIDHKDGYDRNDRK